MAHQKRRHTTGLGAQQQPPGRCQIQSLVCALHLADHRRQGGTAGSFLHGPKMFLDPARLHRHQPGRVNAEPDKSRSVKLSGFPFAERVLNPKHRAGARRHEPCKQGKNKAGDRAGVPAFRAHHFVQGAQAKSSGGKQAIQVLKAEGQRLTRHRI